jgi:hypothetical protein
MNFIRFLTFWSILVLALVASAEDSTTVEVLDNYSGGGLGTKLYPPTPTEKKFLKALPEMEQTPVDDGDHAYTMQRKAGKKVGWFGIIREVTEKPETNRTELLVEMKYSNGFTDLHQQILSICGGGDFKAVVRGVEHDLQRLSLVRIYGTVRKETPGIPTVDAIYLRWWPWGAFAFMEYGKDHSNPKWIKERKQVERVYSSHPDKTYYEERIGKRD